MTTYTLAFHFLHLLHIVAVFPSFPLAHIPQHYLEPLHVKDLIDPAQEGQPPAGSFPSDLLPPSGPRLPGLLMRPGPPAGPTLLLSSHILFFLDCDLLVENEGTCPSSLFRGGGLGSGQLLFFFLTFPQKSHVTFLPLRTAPHTPPKPLLSIFIHFHPQV